MRARKAVEDRAVGAILRFEPIEEDPDDGLVGDELPATHVAVGLTPERRVIGDRGAQEIARCQDGDAEPFREDRGLGALACSGSPEQDENRHSTHGPGGPSMRCRAGRGRDRSPHTAGARARVLVSALAGRTMTVEVI